MTCPMYLNGMDRKREPTVDEICRGWGLDYNMGKAIECIRTSVGSDPVARAKLLEEASRRITNAQMDAEKAVCVSKREDVNIWKTKPKAPVADNMPKDVPETTSIPNGPATEEPPKETPKADNMPDPLDQLRKVMEAAKGNTKPTDDEVNDMLDSIVGLLGLQVPEGTDIQTIRSVDNLVRHALDVVSDIKRKGA